MRPQNADDVRTLLARSGLEVPQERLDDLAKTLEEYRPKLALLFEVDVDAEETAGRLSSGMAPGRDRLMASAASDLHHLTISQAGRLIEARELSPVELTQAFLDRIDALDGELNSYVTLLRDEALSQARSAEAEIGNGQYRGPLHGIPMAHKDLYDTKGVRTTGQSLVHQHRVPTEDATVIRLLGEAGSILLGKLAMYEFAMGGPKTSLFKQAKNPWNTDRVTSGSSSGSVARQWPPVSPWVPSGSDTGCSIPRTRILVRHSGAETHLRAGEPVRRSAH